MSLLFFFFGLFLKWNIKAELARRHPKSPNLARRMRTRRTTTRENQWGDNEEEEVSKDPEGPALGDYDSNGCCFNSLCCPLKTGVGGTDLGGLPPCSGVTEPITILTVLLILTLNRCRWRAELALPTGAGLMYMCGRHQLGHPAQWWIWCRWIDSSVHGSSMRSPFPELIRLRVIVFVNIGKDTAWVTCFGQNELVWS